LTGPWVLDTPSSRKDSGGGAERFTRDFFHR
jgi:hypothetical protein